MEASSFPIYISLLYRKLQAGRAVLQITSRDPGVQQVARLRLEREAKAQRMNFKPLSTIQEVFRGIPDASRKVLSVKMQRLLQDQDVCRCLAHAATLQVQGKLFDLAHDESCYAWSKAIQSASSVHLKFALNAAQDTLPHNANVSKWRRDDAVSDKCKLCGDRQSRAKLLQGGAEKQALQ